MRSESGQRHQQGWLPRLWGRELLQQELSPQEMSHSPVGATATSASAAGVSGGERVPETACVRVCVCPCLRPRVRAHTGVPRTHVCTPVYARALQRVFPPDRGMPSLGTSAKFASHRV